jgi:hypothetical protein
VTWVKEGTVMRRQAVKLDGSGNGSVTFGVDWSANHRWTIEDVVIHTDQAQTTAPYPQVVLNLGGQQAGTSVGASWLGNQVTMRGKIVMDSGLDLNVQLNGGVAGSTATVRIEGSSERWQ